MVYLRKPPDQPNHADAILSEEFSLKQAGHSFPSSGPHLQLPKMLFEFVTDCLASFRLVVKMA